MSSAKCDNPGKYKYILLYLYMCLSQKMRWGVARVGRVVPAGSEQAEMAEQMKPVPGHINA